MLRFNLGPESKYIQVTDLPPKEAREAFNYSMPIVLSNYKD